MAIAKQARQQKKEQAINPFEKREFTQALMKNLDNIDDRSIRSKFKNAQDPINLAFQTIDNTSLKTLAKDFVKEGFSDFFSFISELVRN